MFKLLFCLSILNSPQSLPTVSRLIIIVLTINKNNTKRKIWSYMSTFKVGFAIHFNLDMANLSTPFKHSTICLISFVLNCFLEGIAILIWWEKAENNFVSICPLYQVWNTKTKIRLCLIIRCYCHFLVLQTFAVVSGTFIPSVLYKKPFDIKSFLISDFICDFRSLPSKWMSSRSALMVDDIAWLRVRSS